MKASERRPISAAFSLRTPPAFSGLGRSRGQDGALYGSAEYIAGRVLFLLLSAPLQVGDAPGGDSSNARRGDWERFAGNAVHGPESCTFETNRTETGASALEQRLKSLKRSPPQERWAN